MRSGTIWAMVVTAVLTIASAVTTGAFAFFMWALALNGYMGQEQAVNASMITFIVLATIASLICIALAIFAVYFLSGRREWNAAVTALLSILVFATASGVFQFAAVFISAIVADQMRTNR